MRGYNLSISKLALISTLTIFLIGFSTAFTVEGDQSTSEDKIYTTGEITISDNGGQKIGLIEGEEIEVNTVQKQISEFEGFDETKPEPGERVDLGVIYSEDGEVEFGDEVRYIDGETGEERESYSNLNVYSREDGTYYFIIPDYNPSANFNDIIEIDGKISETATDNVNLAEEFDLQNNHGAVTLYDSIENNQKTVYVDNSGLEFNSAELGESKDTINLQFENKGPTPVDEEEFTQDGEIQDDLFSLNARETKLGTDDPEISDIEFNEEDTSFTVTLVEKFELSDGLDISTTESLQDTLGNQVEASTKTVEGLYSAKPEIEGFNLNEEEITHGEKINGEVLVRSLDRPELELSTGSLEIVNPDYKLQERENCDFESNACYKAELDFTYTSGESGEQSIEVTATNDNGEVSESDTVDIKTRSNSVEEILVFDGDEDGSIDEAEVKFDQKVDPSTFEKEQWFMDGEDRTEELILENEDQTATKSLTLKAEENGIDSTDSKDVDVIHEPGVDDYLAYKDGVRVEQLEEDISEKDRAAPVLEDIKVREGYNFGVLEFSESVENIVEADNGNWDTEIIEEDGKNTHNVIADFNTPLNEGHIESVYSVTAEDEHENSATTSEVKMTPESKKLGLMEGNHIISTPDENSFADLEGEIEDDSWIDSAFNYEGEWVSAETVTANQGTYMKVDRAGYLELKETDSLPTLPEDLDSEWNLFSPFLLNGNPTGLFNDQVCEDGLQVINPETQQEEDDVECNSEGEIGLSVNSVFNGYWVTDPQ